MPQLPQRRGAPSGSDAGVLCSPATYVRGVPYERLERLRTRTPVTWLADEGAWAVLRYADVRRALEHPELFGSPPGQDLHGPVSRAGGEHAGCIDMDPPTGLLIERMTGPEPVDFVTQVAADLPETLRNTLAGGLYALLRHPRQHELLREGGDRLLDSAVEEVLRWWTPVMRLRRTVLRNTSMGGVPLLAGEDLVLWLTAANRDEAAFEEPDRFQAARFLHGAPPHLGLGHGGRSCLGGRLARVHLRTFLAAVVDHPGRPESSGKPVPLRSSARHGFERLPIRWAG
ncbi:cytochrome P450 [Actinomadura hibisca]|uniref:cytochrome P450 n=1 Tax=Actinomadura hibisca TaxID=68565 RepID=UPI0009FD540A|nr:cytochrome P450 [Actinomadura hibisca]